MYHVRKDQTIKRLSLLITILVCAMLGQSRYVACAQQRPSLVVTLLGTGNPRPTLLRGGPAILIEADTSPPTRILLDCGRDTSQRLYLAGGRDLLAGIDLLLLTHLHSDHVVGIPDLWLSGWLFGRARPLVICGPAGTRELAAGLEKAYAFDVHTRRDLDEKLPAQGAILDAREIEPNSTTTIHGVKIVPILVDHGPVKPAYGFRIEYAQHSVVFSGDTRYCPALVEAAKGCDVLVHEVIEPEVERRLSQLRSPAATQKVIEHHTTPEDAGRIFTAVHPALAVFSHIVPSPTTSAELEAATRPYYTGPLLVGEDMTRIEIGSRVRVVKPRKGAIRP